MKNRPAKKSRFSGLVFHAQKIVNIFETSQICIPISNFLCYNNCRMDMMSFINTT